MIDLPLTNFGGINMSYENDEIYLATILNPIRKSADYKPKFGHRKKEGYTASQFQELYGSDTFYSWLGLDNPLLYAAHKAAGGMTSIYRQIGIGCENLFRRILQNVLLLSEDDTKWSYEVHISGNRTRKLSLDGRIPINNIQNNDAKERISSWISEVSDLLDIDPSISESLKGVVFEVRQGYKSKDSKRQNADIANASTAYTQAYLPCGYILSTQIDEDILDRYRAEKWLMLVGSVDNQSDLQSSYAFMKNIIGYDLAGFFNRNSSILKEEVDRVLRILLEP